MKCKWSSNINTKYICNHNADETGYCIFHKKHKTKEENKIFFKLIKEKKISDLLDLYLKMILIYLKLQTITIKN